MVQPERAIVKPRYISSTTGESLPLEDEVLSLVAKRSYGVIYLIGGVGSGKTTALQHLASVLPADCKVHFVDEFEPVSDKDPDTRLVIRAEKTGVELNRAGGYRIATWSVDDQIEYLLAMHPRECQSVMSRITSTDRRFLQGNAELYALVLNELALHPEIASARVALNRYLQDHLGDAESSKELNDAILTALVSGTGKLQFPAGLRLDVAQILRHQQVQVQLAAKRIADDLQSGADCKYLEKRLPRNAVYCIAEEVAGRDAAKQQLKKIISRRDSSQSMAVNILHLADAKWVPVPESVSILSGAYLDHAKWAEVKLPKAFFYDCDFAQADLAYADFTLARTERSTFRGVRLSRAILDQFQASECDFDQADLLSLNGPKSKWRRVSLNAATFADADLSGAKFDACKCVETVFAGADLTAAVFDQVELIDANFSFANLSAAKLAKQSLRKANFFGARFVGANLRQADLEDQALQGLDFQDADMHGVLLTGAIMSQANLRGAKLTQAGLGDVDLEGACLANADLRGASFHLGSSRSGLLFTGIASEGTRTGFYTDDADEQNFKAPEEIRKANLCGADLRGACVTDVDFYLVDLRRALYTAEQELHFRRCRAILENKKV